MNIPTRPGWWLIEAPPEDNDGESYEAVRVRQGKGGLLISGKMPNRVDQRPDIVWLAEVPAPDVCRAVARRMVAEVGLARVAHHPTAVEWDEWDAAVDELAELFKTEAAARKGQEVTT